MSKQISTDKHEVNLENLAEIIEDSWLGVSINYDTLSNPLLTIPTDLHDKPHLWLVYLMSRPEYFSFMGREIFGIEFFPFQTTILKEMWEHKFPMLIGARGMSKCVSGNTRIVTQKGIRRIRDVVGEAGKHEERIYLKDEKVYTENNKWIGVEYGWKNRRDKTLKFTVDCGLSIEVKYDHKMRVVPKGMKDEDIVWRPANEIQKGDRLVVQAPQSNISHIPGLDISNEQLNNKVQQFSETRGISGEFWNFNIKQANVFISHLLNKFSVRKRDRVSFIFQDQELIKELQLYIYYFTGFLFKISPLGVLECDFSKRIRQKFIDKVVDIESGEACTYDLHLKSDHTYLSNGFVSHNSFTLGMYALLRAALIPGRKVVIVGSVFRQSKIIFQYIDTIYQNSGRLREMLGNNRPKKSPDKWELSVGSSLITAIPVGCLATDTLITTEDGIYEMGDFSTENVPKTIYSVDKFKDVGFFYDNGVHDCKKITTKYGYSFTGTPNHKMKVVRDNEIVWCRADEMVVGDKVLIDISKRWFKPKYEYTNKEMYEIGIELSNYKIPGIKIPSKILNSTKDNIRHLVKGFVDSNAFVDKVADSVEIASVHKGIIDQLHYIFLHFGLVAKKGFDGKGYGLITALCDYDLAFDDDYFVEKDEPEIFYDTIENIEDVASVYTVDLNVPEDNTYTANGFVSHNTGDSIRGLRCLDKESLIQTENGLIKLQNFLDGKTYRVVNHDGELERPDKIFCTPPTDVYEVTTQYGYKLECSEIHRVVTPEGPKLAKDLKEGDRILIDDTNYFPSDLVTNGNFVLDEDLSWLMGVLISKGINTDRNNIIIRSGDKEFIERIQKRFPQYDWTIEHKQTKDDGRGWKCNDRWFLKTRNEELRTALRGMGLDYWISADAEIPSGILQSPRNVIVSFLSGLYDADYRKPSINNNSDKKTLIITYGYRGKKLLEQLHVLLLKLNIISSFFLEKGTYGRITCRNNNALDLVEMLTVDKWNDIKGIQRRSINNEHFLRVRKVEKQPEQRVLYDFHLPKTHSFMANGLSNLNSNDILGDEFSCLTRNTYLQTDQGLVQIKDYMDGTPFRLLNQNGEFETPDNIFITSPTDVYEVKTKYGFKFKCSNIHKTKTEDGWKLAKDLTPVDKVIVGSLSNNYFPSRCISEDDLVLDEELGWLIGLLVSEGCMTNRNYITIKNTDRELIDSIKNKFGHLDWGEQYRKAYIDERGWNCKDSWDVYSSDTEFRTKLKQLGLDYVVAKDKTVPTGILRSPKSVIISFLSGLYEGDGSAFYFDNKTKGKKEFQTVYYSVSLELLEALQVLLLKFNILSNINDRGEGNYRLVTTGNDAVMLFNLLDVLKWKEITPPAIKQENSNTGLSLPIVSVTKLAEKEVLYDFHLPKTHSFIGNGIIQHNSQNREIFENVIAGFNAVSSSPVQKVKDYYQEKLRKTLGVELEDKHEEYFPDNQLILSGTAYYYFNHFAQYWERWRSIINSKGDIEKLREVFNGEIPEDLDWKDFSVIRIPVELLPKGYMDQANLARSKATLSSHLYDMEFSACSTADTPIQTLEGVKSIVEVKPGDKVLTHTGQFKKVEKNTQRPYSGELLEFKYKRSPFTYKFTPDHLFFLDNEFIELEDIFYKKGKLSSVADNSICNEYVSPKRKKTKKEKGNLNIKQYISPELYLELDNQLFHYTYSYLPRRKAQQIVDLYSKNVSLTSIAKTTSSSLEQINKVIDIVSGGGGVDQSLDLDYELGKLLSLFALYGRIVDDSSIEIDFVQINKANKIASSIPGSNYGSRSHVLFSSNITAFCQSCVTKIGNPAKKVEKTSRNRVLFTDPLLVSIIKGVFPGGDNPNDLYLSDELIFSNDNFIRGYLHTLLISSYKQLNKIKIKNTVCTERKKIIEQSKLMMEYFGFSPFLNIDGRDPNKVFLSFNIHDSNKILEDIFLEKTEYFQNLRKIRPIRNENDNIYREISSFKRIPYDGMVYNLEVEEDHSYSTPDATMHNCFSKDSNGFFKASLIEACTANEINNIQIKVNDEEYETIIYDPRMYGDKSKSYVFGIDPASEVDKFAIVILELHDNHARIVHVWTTNAEKFKRQKRAGIDIAIKDDYYSYCARKIRDLMKRFPCSKIALDAQGGGKAISEALRDSDNLEDDEQKIWPVIDPEKSSDTDGESGLHILELVQFASYEYTRDANHGLRKDFEDRKCLFPRYNPAALAYATTTNHSQFDETEIDAISIYDTMEDNFMEIQELKSELSQIVVTLTGGGREKFDTPEVKISGAEKGRARKDRYSALVMANATARRIIRGEEGAGFITSSFETTKEVDIDKNFIGPSWASNKLDDLYS